MQTNPFTLRRVTDGSNAVVIPFGMNVSKWGAERRVTQLGNSRRNKVLEKTSVRNHLFTGSVRRAAQIYFVGPFEMTFHSECMSLDGGLRVAQRSSGIQDGTRSSKRLPFEFTFFTGSVRRAAQIYFVGPFEMIFHSACMSVNGRLRGA